MPIFYTFDQLSLYSINKICLVKHRIVQVQYPQYTPDLALFILFLFLKQKIQLKGNICREHGGNFLKYNDTTSGVPAMLQPIKIQCKKCAECEGDFEEN